MDDFEEQELWWEQHARPHTDEEMVWFRLWFEFLQESDEQNWSNSVVQHFGDLPDEFDEWWPEHSYLFREMKNFLMEEIISDDDFQAYKDDGSMPEDPGAIILAFNPYEKISTLRSAFDELLAKHHKGVTGRPKFESNGDIYAFKNRPDTDMLNKILAVYRLYAADQKKPKKEQMPLWQIEEEVSKTTPLIDKTGKQASYIWTTKDIDASIIESRRRSQHTTVSKYLKYADQILENVVVGKFPVYDQS